MIRKETILIFLFSFFIFYSRAQEVFINGVEGNRKLAWTDFVGRPDENSSFAAFTWWDISYRFSGVEFNGDTANLIGWRIKLELNGTKSWVKKGRESENLLTHEQGHFDIGLLCLLDLMRTFDSTRFLRSDLATKPRLIFQTTLEKYRALSLKYDSETDHSKYMRAQIKWNHYLNNELLRLVPKY